VTPCRIAFSPEVLQYAGKANKASSRVARQRRSALKRDRARTAAREKQFNEQKVQGLASNNKSNSIASSFYHATACNATYGIVKALLSVRLSAVCQTRAL